MIKRLFTIALLALPILAQAQPFSLNDRAFLDSTSTLRRDLVGYWAFEETSGTRYDRSRFGNTLTAVNNPFNIAAKVRNGIFLSPASTQSLTRADSSSLSMSLGVPYTLTAWCLISSTNTDLSIVTKSSNAAATGGYQIRYAQNFDRFRYVSSDGLAFTGINADAFGPIATNTWYFVRAWWSGSSNCIQINNGSTNAVVDALGTQDDTNTFNVGSNPVNSSFFHGIIDEVGLWKRLLTTSEVAQLYNSGRGVTFPQFYKPANLSGGPSVVFDGDSRSAFTYESACYNLMTPTAVGWQVSCTAHGGNAVSTLATLAPTEVDPLYSSQNSKNIFVIWGGVNDAASGANAADIWGSLQTICTNRHNVGFKVILCSEIDAQDSSRNNWHTIQWPALNGTITNSWATIADGLADLGNDSRLQDANNTTYFADKVHLTAAGYNVVAGIVAAAINALP